MFRCLPARWSPNRSPRPGAYTSAMPFSTHEQWLKNAAHLRHLDSMAEKIRALEQKINELERKQS